MNAGFSLWGNVDGIFRGSGALLARLAR